ncbi:MAG: GIY-YIG nuclease family protein [Elusimicrobia bacterium]|nr:GIY-YIG nuclease family protein [Elusimicrobiota bacterium]
MTVKGVYILCIRLRKSRNIRVGRLGDIFFRKGTYLYAGSALGGIEARLKRHIGKDKKLHWHIDYLLDKAHVITAAILRAGDKRNECAAARKLSRVLTCVPGFGSGDCGCGGHLYYAGDALHGTGGFLREYGLQKWEYFNINRL